jgi:Xaa-Pro aminopeptidase
MKFDTIVPSFFSKNRQALIHKMKDDSIAFFFSHDELWRNGDQHFPYRQNSDFYYLTGILQASTILVLEKKNSSEYSCTLFIPKSDKKKEIWFGHLLSPQEAENISEISSIAFVEDFNEKKKELLKSKKTIYVHHLENESVSQGMQYMGDRFRASLKGELLSLNDELTILRLTKQKEELNLIQKAIDITHLAFKRVVETLKNNHYEYEVEAEITYIYTRNGATHAYAPIIASGLNATVLHYIENKDKLKNGDLLLMDFGAEYTNYAADCSRTVPINGKFSDRQKVVYEAVLRVQNTMIREYIPGNTIHKLNQKAGELMEKELLNIGLISEEEIQNQDPKEPAYKKYFMHGLAHFLGLDVHDSGDKETVFKKGMVLTCEPGIYIPEENIGIRIEDDILVDETPVNLMAKIPKSVKEIEKLLTK